MQAADSRHILFVLGMHRSGTSALCAALQACGASFGSHLLEPMDGVNDEGFWEDADVVAVNQSLLAAAGVHWYSVTPTLAERDWQSPEFDTQRDLAGQIIQRGFGSGQLEVVKDPRLCLTLPFWLALCAQAGVASSVCVITRAPMEVARSLEKRDGFPVGYGLRLYQAYQLGIARHAPRNAMYLSYDQLLAQPAQSMSGLSAALPLIVDQQQLAPVVRDDLRHHAAVSGADGPLYRSGPELADTAALATAINEAYPLERTLAELVSVVVDRGEQLTRIGGAHSTALATLDARDADLARLSEEHRQALATIDQRDEQIRALDQRLAATGDHLSTALATIDERDQQIAEFDRRLSKLGDEHSHALELIQSRDQQLRRVFAKPAIGLLFKAMWQHEQR